MGTYSFIMNAAVSVAASSEKEARELLATATSDDDAQIGQCGVYIPPNQENTADMNDYWPDAEDIENGEADSSSDG